MTEAGLDERTHSMYTTRHLHRQVLPPMTPVRLTVSRRVVDIAVALGLLVLLSPLLLCLVALVRTVSGKPVIFRHPRMGEGGQAFTLYKFRTMRQDATGSVLTSSRDPRVTGTGRLLRRFHLDELPQLVNVLRGDMTLVGPRPESVNLARRFPPEYRWMFRHRPGLTGPCQLLSRSHAALLDGMPDPEEYYLSVMVPRRAAMNAELLAHINLSTVVRYIVRTLWYLLSAAWDRSDDSSGRPGADATQWTEEGRSLCVPS